MVTLRLCAEYGQIVSVYSGRSVEVVMPRVASSFEWMTQGEKNMGKNGGDSAFWELRSGGDTADTFDDQAWNPLVLGHLDGSWMELSL